MSDSLAHFLSGAGGGVVATAITYPLLNLATRLQVQQRKEKGKEKGKERETEEGRKAEGEEGEKDLLRVLLSEEGFKGLYAGLSSALVGVAVSNGIFYLCYEWLREYWINNHAKDRKVSTLLNLVISALAGTATALGTNPIWVVNTRMSVKGHSATTAETIMHMFRQDGPGVFFRGVLPGLVLVSNPVIQFMVFERLKTRVETKRKKLTDLDFFLLGLVSKFVASTTTYPYTLLKTKLQAKDSPYNGMAISAILQKIFRDEGVSGLFVGYKPRIVQSVLTAAILFLAKERFFQLTIFILTLVGLRKPSKIHAS